MLTKITIESDEIGVYSWPWEKMVSYKVAPGIYQITFKGYDIENKKAYYTLEINKKS